MRPPSDGALTTKERLKDESSRREDAGVFWKKSCGARLRAARAPSKLMDFRGKEDAKGYSTGTDP